MPGWRARQLLASVGALVALVAPALAVAPGEIVVADFPAAPQPSALVRFDAAGNPLGSFAGATQGITAPRDLAFDAAGNLYVADNAAVLVFDGNGHRLPSLTQGLATAQALAFGASGSLFVSNRIASGASEILRYAPGGALLQTWAIPEFDSGGPKPFAREMAFGPDGLLYRLRRSHIRSGSRKANSKPSPQAGTVWSRRRARNASPRTKSDAVCGSGITTATSSSGTGISWSPESVRAPVRKSGVPTANPAIVTVPRRRT